jgi:hypothetical protein
LLLAAGSHATPALPHNSIPHAEDVFALLSKTIKQSAEAMAAAEKMAVDSLHSHLPSVSNERPIRKMLQEEGAMSCSAASTSECTQQGASASVQACMMAVFRASSGSPMSSPFTFPSLLCQLGTTNSSCVSSLINFFKTCACVDFQPMFDLACPASPSAHSCASNTFARRFLALNTNSSLGFFGTSLMNFPMPSTEGPRPSLLTCGDAETYRRIVLINGLGSCLGPIIDAFPLPTYMLAATIPGSSRKLADMLKGGMRCALTQASYNHDTNCRGNIARCYSLRQTSDFGDCASATGTSCSAGCRDRLAAVGATSSTSPAKCCVKWFQQQSTADDCDAKVSLSSIMGPACTAFMRTMMPAPSPSQPGQPTPEQINQMFTMPLFPGPCAAKSAESLAVSNCNVPVAGLQAACPTDDTPFVLSSLFAPKKTTTATITFTSSSLKAVSGCLAPLLLPLYSIASLRVTTTT